MTDGLFKKNAIHFTHANGIPSATYQKFFNYFKADFNLKAIPMIGLNPQYPVTMSWQYLVEQVIADIEQQFPDQQVIGLGHSFGSLVTLMAAYKRPDLFSQLIIMDPPFVIGSKSAIFEAMQKLKLKAVDKITPAAITLKRNDHWRSFDEAYTSLRNNRLFKNFDKQCFDDYFAHGITQDQSRGGVTLSIPKAIEAEIFRTVPAWWWRTPRKAPRVPVHLITAEQSHFYKQGLPQGMKKTYGVEFSVVEGGHMFPLEQPESTAQSVKKIISAQQNIECAVKNLDGYSSQAIKL
ncbi:alpha/beta hydrolase [Acinetobacter sp. SM34]|uniref:alpha/beta fold hydrolase n=1 Tax=Acinetobacter sp. SM34 TaxID=1301620 RepID=UPI001ED9D32F|nr:alpha/beta hydrolase [Acinetobacter sp. SM34]MCG2609823.1 alpha/beta hydrolase [Acinetobacter sp. SM34]